MVRRHRGGRSESGGGIHAVTDDEILDAYRFLADRGVGVLRAGVGGVGRRPARSRRARRGATVVCILTGHGLKDPDRAIAEIAVPSPVDADYAAVRAELGL